MPKPRNPRRVVLEMLNPIFNGVKDARYRWQVRSDVFLDYSNRDPANPGIWSRPRLPHEYPENRPAAWRALQREMTDLAAACLVVADFARQQEAQARKALEEQ